MWHGNPTSWALLLAYAALDCIAFSRSLQAEKPTGAVYGEEASLYPDSSQQSVELVRFVTAYRMGLDVLVDLTPYSPLLRAAASADGQLTLYGMIDTWVNNESATTIMYMSNETGQCSPLNHSDGHGWALSADLIFWPREEKEVDTRPTKSITLASGIFGGVYSIGEVSIHEGTLVEGGSAVQLNEAADFKHAVDAAVYPCPDGTGQLESAAFLGYMARQANFMAKKKDKAGMKQLRSDMLEELVWDHMALVSVTHEEQKNNTVWATYDSSISPTEDLPVFFMPSDVITDQIIDGDVWYNMSVPFKKVGRVVEAQNGVMKLKLDHPCLPQVNNSAKPQLIIPKDASIFPQARALVASTVQTGRDWSLSAKRARLEMNVSLNEIPETLSMPLLLEPSSSSSVSLASGITLAAPAAMGSIDLGDKAASGPHHRMAALPQLKSNASSKVCVVERKRQGSVFQREFDLPDLGESHVVMQFAVTGHGWASTEEQCGEYCHAVYQVGLNGKSTANITEFRDDCEDNPISDQYGTWWEDRNGWGPGTVEPGVFLDITNSVKSGLNVMTFDLAVWSSMTEAYEQYTDYAGFAMHDAASLTIGLTVFVYSDEAVKAIRLQDQAYSAAEMALRDGSSRPEALHPPSHPVQPKDIVLMENHRDVGEVHAASQARGHRSKGWFERHHNNPFEPHSPQRRNFMQSTAKAKGPSAAQRKASEAPAGDEKRIRMDFEKRAPWYVLGRGTGGFKHAVDSEETSKLKAFKKRLVQGESRVVLETINAKRLPSDWSQVGLRLRLTRPDGMDYDHWDRQASLGLLFNKDSADLQLHPAVANQDARSWKMNLA